MDFQIENIVEMIRLRYIARRSFAAALVPV